MKKSVRRLWMVLSLALVTGAALLAVRMLPAGEVIETGVSLPESPAETSSEPASTPEPSSQPEPEPSVVTFLSAGDDLIHNSIYEQAAARAENGGYDFTYAYANVAETIRAADIATINQETVIAPMYEPSTYPCFNSPPQLADTLQDIGFDVYNVANNHVLDKGETGLINCLEFWRDSWPDALVTGAYLNEEDYSQIRTLEKNGLTFAFLGMTELTNGLSLPQGSEVVLVQGEDEAALQSRIQAAREVADVVIMNVHWGNEYTHTPTERQRYLAEKMTDWGVDIVIGHHPHVLQPIETRTTADGRQALIAYSLGNFISAQDRPARMLGGLLSYTVRRETPDSPIEITDVALIPTVTHYDRGFTNNRIYLLSQYTNELAQSHGVRSNYPEFGLDFIQDTLAEVIGRDYLPAGTLPEEPEQQNAA